MACPWAERSRWLSVRKQLLCRCQYSVSCARRPNAPGFALRPVVGFANIYCGVRASAIRPNRLGITSHLDSRDLALLPPIPSSRLDRSLQLGRGRSSTRPFPSFGCTLRRRRRRSYSALPCCASIRGAARCERPALPCRRSRLPREARRGPARRGHAWEVLGRCSTVGGLPRAVLLIDG